MMDSLNIAATGRTPDVNLDFATGVLCMRGESYPDDVATFFGPIFAALRAYLAEPGDGPIRFDMELVYFNSSSAKALMNIFQMLETVAEQGRSVAVNWYYDPGDDAMQELGEDFAEDLTAVVFTMKENPAD
jgi:hypothetical protein